MNPHTPSRCITAALLASLAPLASLQADSAFWNGTTDATWADADNWDGPPTTVPGTGETATFDQTSTNTTIDLGGAVTIGTLQFNNGADPYTIGLFGTDTLTFDNGGRVNLDQLLASGDQAIAADIVLGDGTANTFRIDQDSTANKITISGDFDTGTGTGTPGIQRLEIGDLTAPAGGELVEITGDINETGDATRLDLFVGGADLVMTGNVNGTGNTQRTYIRFGNTATVNGTGNLGQGSMEVRWGTLNINSDAQQFDNNLYLGQNDQANGNATVNIGAANTLILNTGLTYRDDDNTANVGLVAGGTLQITGSNRTFIAENNPLIDAASPELTVTSTIGNDGSDRDLTIRNTGGGTLLIAPTAANNTFGAVTFQEGTLQLGPGALDTGGDFLTVAAQNNANTVADTVATVDLMGTTHALGNPDGAAGAGGNINLGAANTSSITTNGFQGNVVDTVGGGKLTSVNQIVYQKGTGTGVQRNSAATISADVDFDDSGANKTITINNGSADTDLTISSALNTTGAATDDITVIGDGTLSFSGTLGFNGTVNGHDRTIFQNRKTILLAGADPGGASNFQVEQRNNATFSDFEVELDINGQDLVLEDQMNVSAFSTNLVATIQSTRITDSVGTGRVILTGATDGNRNIVFNPGNTVGKENKTAFFSANVRAEGGTMQLNVSDGADTIDLDLSGTITCDNNTRQINKNNPGTVRLSATDNVYGVLQISAGTVIITNGGALGSDDIGLGNNITDGILEYTGSGETLGNQVRVGDNNAAATRVGDGGILNNGTGGLTFTNATFTQTRPVATVPRTLTLGGTNTGGDNVISGAIIDNSAVGSTVAVTKTGTNTWLLAGANTYTGDTDVLAGRLNVNGTVGGNLTVADGASFGGDATFAGTVTLGTTAATNLYIDGSSGGALTATGVINTSNGVNVFVDANGADGIVVLNYNGGGTISTGDFTLDAGVAVSARVAGVAGPFVDTGSAITIDLGFEALTWTNGSTDNLWNINSSLNWSGGDTVFYDGDLVTFDDTPGSAQTIALTENVAPDSVTFANDAANDYTINDSGGGETLTVGNQMVVSGTNTVTINSVIAGSGSLYKGDNSDGVGENGILNLNGVNTYSGGTLLEEGTLRITNDSALGTGTVTLSDGTGTNTDPILDLDQATGFDLTNDIVYSDTGNGKIVRLANSGTNTGTISGAVTTFETSRDNARFQVGDDDTLTITGLISGTGGVMKDNPGTLVLANSANTFTRTIVAADGIVELASIGNSGIPSHAGAGTYLVIGSRNKNGTLSYTGAGETTDRQIQIGNRWFGDDNQTGAGTLANNSPGNGALIFTNSTFNFLENQVGVAIGPRTLTLGGTSTATNEIDGIIQDNTPSDAFDDETVGIDVDTSGTWQLDGANIYTGATTVTAGTLLVNGSTTAASAVTVNGGTIGGTGTIGGSLTVAAAGNVAPGASAGTLFVTGTLDISAMAGGAGTLDFELDAPAGTNDLIAVTGNLLIGSGVFGIDDISITDLGGLGVGTYTLITSAGITGTLDTTVSGLIAPGLDGEVQINGTNIDLVVTVGGSAYDDWALAAGLDGSNNAPNDDPDGDGKDNFYEFAFDGDPLDPADNGKTASFTNDGTDDKLVLTIAVRSGTPVFAGTPSPTATHDGVIYTVQGSTDLATFTTNVSVVDPAVTTGLPTPSADYEYRSFSLDGSTDFPSEGFLQAVAEEAP